MPKSGDEFQAEAAARNIARDVDMGFGANRFDVSALLGIVSEATVSAQNKAREIQQRGDAISIGDMFEMQMLMNHLSQLSEMSTAVVSAANSAITSMARNVKG